MNQLNLRPSRGQTRAKWTHEQLLKIVRRVPDQAAVNILAQVHATLRSAAAALSQEFGFKVSDYQLTRYLKAAQMTNPWSQTERRKRAAKQDQWDMARLIQAIQQLEDRVFRLEQEYPTYSDRGSSRGYGDNE